MSCANELWAFFPFAMGIREVRSESSESSQVNVPKVDAKVVNLYKGEREVWD